MLCRDCGYVPQCPHCDISLTYHKSTDQLKCHYCGYHEVPPNKCPNCESSHIRQVGTGTQRVEEILQQEFEEARIIRMDVDTTSRKGAHEKLLNEFEEGKGDIFIRYANDCKRVGLSQYYISRCFERRYNVKST